MLKNAQEGVIEKHLTNKRMGAYDKGAITVIKEIFRGTSAMFEPTATCPGSRPEARIPKHGEKHADDGDDPMLPGGRLWPLFTKKKARNNAAGL